VAASSGFLVLAHAESARIVTAVYAMALVAALPVAAAAVAAWMVRRATADVRAMVWRSAIVALVVVVVGRELPVHWMAWIVPSFFAAPLVALGRVQVTTDSAHSVGMARDVAAADAGTIAFVLLAIYAAGVVIVAARTLVAWHRLRRSVTATAGDDAGLGGFVASAAGASRWRRAPRVIASSAVGVPMTWGWLRPVIVLPAEWRHGWSESHTRMALMHELAHVRSSDWAFYAAGRAVCALLWFHPGVWWIARALREECEQACDDRVIAAGVRRSDYAELLLRAAQRGGVRPVGAALALSRRRGLRPRLAAVLDADHDVRPIDHRRAVAAMLIAVIAAAPISVAQLAPTREVLTNLMLSAQWESRAYAVLGLAERADSVAVARSAAERDPSPRVRAWARYALDRRGGLPTLVPLTREP
jgi:beta-lactamase regulating signal transducer with metallopeptidase domain